MYKKKSQQDITKFKDSKSNIILYFLFNSNANFRSFKRINDKISVSKFTKNQKIKS